MAFDNCQAMKTKNDDERKLQLWNEFSKALWIIQYYFTRLPDNNFQAVENTSDESRIIEFWSGNSQGLKKTILHNFTLTISKRLKLRITRNEN